jgi:hypothetical protein
VSSRQPDKGATVFAGLLIVLGLYILGTAELPFMDRHVFRLEAILSEMGARITGGVLAAVGAWLAWDSVG